MVFGGFKSQPVHVRVASDFGLGGGFRGYSSFLYFLQLASHKLTRKWHKWDCKQNSTFQNSPGELVEVGIIPMTLYVKNYLLARKKHWFVRFQANIFKEKKTILINLIMRSRNIYLVSKKAHLIHTKLRYHLFAYQLLKRVRKILQQFVAFSIGLFLALDEHLCLFLGLFQKIVKAVTVTFFPGFLGRFIG